MAKKRRTPPTPKLPDKVEHYYRACNETTSDGLEAILAESRKTAKRTFNKNHLGSLDLWESEYGKRRRDAVRHTFTSITPVLVLFSGHTHCGAEQLLRQHRSVRLLLQLREMDACGRATVDHKQKAGISCL